MVTIHDDDEHLFPALQAGAFGYLLKRAGARELIEQLQPHEPGRAAAVARSRAASSSPLCRPPPKATRSPVQLHRARERVLLRVAKGFTLPEIGVQLGLSRHTIADYVKQIYRKLNVSSRAEAALEAQRLGLFGRNWPPGPTGPR